MTHRFGEAESNPAVDPLGVHSFDPGFQNRPITYKGTPQLHIQQHGEYRCPEPMSPVVKPRGGMASLSGPSPDIADHITNVTPAGTKKRTPLKPTGD